MASRFGTNGGGLLRPAGANSVDGRAAASTEEWDELVLSLVFSSGLYPEKTSMNENNLGELCQKVSSNEDSGAPSRLELRLLMSPPSPAFRSGFEPLDSIF